MCRVLTFTEPGGHTRSEDAFEVQRHPEDENIWLCALADGQGGRAGGARAAQLACRTVIEAAGEHPPEALTALSSWMGFLQRADEVVTADSEAGFTTLIGLCVVGDRVIGASCGDSAVLASSARGGAQELTRHQAKNPPIGTGDSVVTPFADSLSRPWLLLAMSDGVWKYAGWERIRNMASQFRGKALLDALQEAARLPRTGALQDDFTVVLLQDD